MFIVWEIDKETKARIAIHGEFTSLDAANVIRKALRLNGVSTEVEILDTEKPVMSDMKRSIIKFTIAREHKARLIRAARRRHQKLEEFLVSAAEDTYAYRDEIKSETECRSEQVRQYGIPTPVFFDMKPYDF